MHINIEFKARVPDADALEKKLLSLQPEYKGEDRQVDTYFNCNNGRLKMREGNIENALIFYTRENTKGSKRSDVILHPVTPGSNLKSALTEALGVKIVVDKRRKIYFIENVKFHFDQVEGLGSFVEVEAIDNDGTIGAERLQEQCDFYAHFFEIEPASYMANSYSDMLLEKV